MDINTTEMLLKTNRKARVYGPPLKTMEISQVNVNKSLGPQPF